MDHIPKVIPSFDMQMPAMQSMWILSSWTGWPVMPRLWAKNRSKGSKALTHPSQVLPGEAS